jgi:MFS family permease
MLAALFVSNAGTALQTAAQAWFLWQTTRRPGALGLLGLVQASPLLGLPFLGGVLADRWSRRTILIATQGTLASVAALMGWLALRHLLVPPLLLLLAGLLAAVAALDNPVRQVYLPGVVRTARRGRMVGLNALAYNVGMVVGPAAAGVLLPLAGAGWCFLLNAASYLATLGWLLAGPPGRPGPAPRGGLGGAIRYVRESVQVRTLLALAAVASLLGRSYPHVLPLLANGVWGGGARLYGLLAALPGIGAVAAAGLTAWMLGRQARPGGWWAGAAALGVGIASLGLAPGALAAGAALLAIGFAATGTMTLLNAGVQTGTPDGIRGRVMSVYTWLAAGMPALGGWLLGTLMSDIRPGVLLVAAGGVLTALALLLERSTTAGGRRSRP